VQAYAGGVEDDARARAPVVDLGHHRASEADEELVEGDVRVLSADVLVGHVRDHEVAAREEGH
jgi:hypothetical protein